MKLQYLLLNLAKKIKKTLASAKSYSDSNLQTGLTYRKLDWANAVKPISTSQKSTWTYTAPKDGQLLIAFFSHSRTYIGMFVNNTRIFDYATTAGNYADAHPVTLILSQGDVFKAGDLNENTYIGTSTMFVPFVGGVTRRLLSLPRFGVAV